MDVNKLLIDRSIDRWDEGLPLGNGELGCLLYGASDRLTLSLDRGDIWDKSGSPENTPGFTYQNMIRFATTGDRRGMSKVFDKPYLAATPTKLPTGKIVFDLGKSDFHNFELNLLRAEAEYRGEDGLFFRTYVHATDGVGMIETNAKIPMFRLWNPKFGKVGLLTKIFRIKTVNAVSNKLKNVKYPSAMSETVEDGGITIKMFLQTIGDGSCFGIAVAEAQSGARREYAYYAYRADSAQEVRGTLCSKVTAALRRGYRANLDTHIKWWAEYNALSSVTLPDKYIENRYRIGNYLLGSGSRQGRYPMALQGLWTECDGVHLPPWKGDYHHDLNTQMTYTSYLKANRLEQGLSFIDFLLSLTKRAEEFAKKFYGAEGLCLPSVMDIDGYAMGGWPMYSLSPTNQLWLCQVIERYYSYTGDRTFLEESAFPYLEKSAIFIASLLKKDSDGFYVLPVSSSPEIHDNTLSSFLTPNSNYDEALLLYHFGAMVRLSETLGRDGARWRGILAGLRPLAVNADNELMLCRTESLTESHRHFSHAMSIFPLRLFNYSDEKDRKVIDATVALAERLGGRNYTGYSYAWLAEFYAAAKDGDNALRYLEIFWKYFCSVNSFHLNGDYTKQGYSSMSYRPFTLEGNFCAMDALQEMLLYSENGIVEVFPALPSSWKEVRFDTLRAWGGVLVSARCEGGVTVRMDFRATNDVIFDLRCNPSLYTFGEGVSAVGEGLARVALKSGERVKFVSK